MKKIIFLVLLLIVILSGCSYGAVNNANPSQVGNPAAVSGKSGGNIVNIEIKNFSFSPAEITIKSGDTVKWTNQDEAPHLVASDPHPTHTDLPGLESKSLAKGDSYEFTFEKTGTYGYHCHLHPSMKGKIVVE
jgi:plastocyanin